MIAHPFHYLILLIADNSQRQVAEDGLHKLLHSNRLDQSVRRNGLSGPIHAEQSAGVEEFQKRRRRGKLHDRRQGPNERRRLRRRSIQLGRRIGRDRNGSDFGSDDVFRFSHRRQPNERLEKLRRYKYTKRRYRLCHANQNRRRLAVFIHRIGAIRGKASIRKKAQSHARPQADQAHEKISAHGQRETLRLHILSEKFLF